MASQKKKTGKNIIICLDGTNNQHGKDKSNVLNLFDMLEREPGKQISYYDPGVGTMGDQTYKIATARKINKALGLAFGRGLMKNVMEAYTFLMENYEDGDKVFIFGFSRGAYTARALAAFIRDCGLLERSAQNLLPYAMRVFLEKAPKEEKKADEFFRRLSDFRGTYSRLLNLEEDPKYPGKKDSANKQLRIHFMGLFDTVKSYGWVGAPVVLRNEKVNPSVLTLRHAISIDERRNFFRQMHWKVSAEQDSKEVWFAGDHSDVGGGHPEGESGLAKIALEWMAHEAIKFGLKVDIKEYCRELTPFDLRKEGSNSYSYPNPEAPAHGEPLGKAWKLVQLLPKKGEYWESEVGMRTIKSQQERRQELKESKELQGDLNLVPVLVHQSVIERMDKTGYKPENLRIEKGVIQIPHEIERTFSVEDVFTPIELKLITKKKVAEKEGGVFDEIIVKLLKRITEKINETQINEKIMGRREELREALKEGMNELKINKHILYSAIGRTGGDEGIERSITGKVIERIKGTKGLSREEMNQKVSRCFLEETMEIIIEIKGLGKKGIYAAIEERSQSGEGIKIIIRELLVDEFEEIKYVSKDKINQKIRKLFLDEKIRTAEENESEIVIKLGKSSKEEIEELKELIKELLVRKVKKELEELKDLNSRVRKSLIEDLEEGLITDRSIQVNETVVKLLAEEMRDPSEEEMKKISGDKEGKIIKELLGGEFKKGPILNKSEIKNKIVGELLAKEISELPQYEIGNSPKGVTRELSEDEIEELKKMPENKREAARSRKIEKFNLKKLSLRKKLVKELGGSA
jgi:uncharacterized protein (DUF2235 family)